MNRNNWMANVSLGTLLYVAGASLGQPANSVKPSHAATKLSHTAVQPPQNHARQIVGARPVPMTPALAAELDEVYRLDQASATALDAGEYAEAEDDARQSLLIGHDSGLAQELLASALNEQGKIQEALGVYQQMADAGDVEPRNQLPYALLLLKTGHWVQAVAAYNKQLPYLADGKLMNANSHFSPDVPQPKELETAIHIALGLTYGSAYSWGKHSQVDKATNEYKKAIAVEPASPLANLYYGRALQRLGRRAEAKAAFAKAAGLAQGDVKAAADEALKE